jgi:hypothetical protein
LVTHRRAARTLFTSRLLVLLVCTVIAYIVPAVLMAAPAVASTPQAQHKPVHRVGGKVHRAWPNGGRKPRSPLARWLARQVGPAKAKPCTRRLNGKLVRCHRALPPRNGVVVPRHNVAITARS